MARLWNPVSNGRCTLTTSRCWKRRTGLNCRPMASPRKPSSMGGSPTMVAGNIASARRVTAVTFRTG